MAQLPRDRHGKFTAMAIRNEMTMPRPPQNIRTYRMVTPLVAAVQWTGDNDSEVRGFGEILSQGTGVVFGFTHAPLQPTATVYVAVHGRWVEIPVGHWVLFDENSGFFTIADETFRRQFREETEIQGFTDER